MEKLDNIHPGEILKLDFMEPLNISVSRLAKDTGLSVRRVGEIIRGQTPVTLEIALRLSRYFRTTPQLWLNLQRSYDLEELQRHSASYADITAYDEKIAA
jgi:addiction module HigA family antidote